MDGTGVVALIIVILFFVNISKPSAVSSAGKTDGSASSVYTELKEDRSAWQYQNISPERTDAVILKYNTNLSASEINLIKINTNLYCKEKDIDPRLILALMARESAFNPRAVSPSGAAGLGQIMPLNFKDLNITDPYDIQQNIRGLVYYFRIKLDERRGEKNQLELALASYLEGSGAINSKNKKIEGHTATYVNDILKIRSTI